MIPSEDRWIEKNLLELFNGNKQNRDLGNLMLSTSLCQRKKNVTEVSENQFLMLWDMPAPGSWTVGLDWVCAHIQMHLLIHISYDIGNI